MSKISLFLSNLLHPAAIFALLFSLGIPLLVAVLGHSGISGPESKELIGKLDLHAPFWIFSAQAILFILLFWDRIRDFGAYIRENMPSKPWRWSLVVFIVIASAVTGLWIEGRHRVQSDESILLSTAQNLYHHKVAGACDEGEFIKGSLHCSKSANNFKARGLSFLYMLGMPVFGKDLRWIFSFHLVLYALTGLVFFFAVLVWTRHNFLALTATVALLFQPTVMFQFRSSSVEPLYVFLSAFSLLIYHWATQRDTVRHWALLALALAFFAQTRQETIFCLGAFALTALPRLLSARDLRFPVFISTLAFFSLPVLFTISYYQGYNFQGGEFEAHGHFWKHLVINWKVMTQTPLQGNGLLANPFLSSAAWLSLFGLIALIAQAIRGETLARKALLFFVLYHIQTYAILENVSGDFTIEINQRYALVIFPTMAFLIAYFLDLLFFEGLARLISVRVGRQALGALVFALIASGILAAITLRHEESFKQNIMYNRNHLTSEEYAILSWIRAQPEKNRLFVYARPWHFIGYGYSSLHYDRLRFMGGGELQDLIRRYDNEVFYVRGLDCWDRQTWHKKAVETRIASVCDDLEKKIEFDTVYKTLITNNYMLTISRIHGLRDFDPQGLLYAGIFHYFEPTKTAIISYRTEMVPNRPWMVEIAINDRVMLQLPYYRQNDIPGGGFIDTIRNAPMISGHNRATVRIVDTTAHHTVVSRDVLMFFPLGKKVTPLSKLTPVFAIQSWGQPQIGRSVLGNPLRVAGRQYADGLGTHAFARLTYALDGGYERLTFLVGQDDEELGGDGMRFRVLGDRKQLWESPVVRGNQVIAADISVKGVQQLVLEVDSLGGKDYDHADWLEPVLFHTEP